VRLPCWWVAGVGVLGWRYLCRSIRLVSCNILLYPCLGLGFSVSSLALRQISISWPVCCHWWIWSMRSFISWLRGCGWCWPEHSSIWVCWVLTVFDPIWACCDQTQYTDAMIKRLLCLPSSLINDHQPILLESWPELMRQDACAPTMVSAVPPGW